MQNYKHHILVIITVGLVVLAQMTACTKEGKLNVFSIEDDKKLGLQLSQQIASDPSKYPVLPKEQYPAAYNHLQRITDNILNSGKVEFRDQFSWQVQIIRDDSTLNAFCAPGGYIYVYTGIIKYLDDESQLAGVMGHEIAHASKRHSTSRMTQAYGVQFLLDMLVGNNNSRMLADVAANLATLAYSRGNETEADMASVEYLCNTEYQSTGAAGFFEKIKSEGGSRVPAFLSTHPNPENRVERIQEEGKKKNCPNSGTFAERYREFKNSLP
jgi:beta-barrel assembly-enhancing protease